MLDAFEGVLLKPGARVDWSTLWPSPGSPKKPLLLEYAGTDRTGRGHNRSKQIHILWRFEPGRAEWAEIARTLSEGAEWIPQIALVAQRELGGPPQACAVVAAEVMRRFLGQLDRELGGLAAADRDAVLHLVYEQIAARVIEAAVLLPDRGVGIQLALPL